ncbi:MAG: hypothetical protein CM1200mP22_33070 [Dehalococcoidia bacterium]|nr:MAG: hypothetical protein CM1200mP22_33070 [Dehalococcoidia bacterium]
MQVMGEPTPRELSGEDGRQRPQYVDCGRGVIHRRTRSAINFHGINEGAPVKDLKNGARIIYRLFVDQIEGR